MRQKRTDVIHGALIRRDGLPMLPFLVAGIQSLRPHLLECGETASQIREEA